MPFTSSHLHLSFGPGSGARVDLGGRGRHAGRGRRKGLEQWDKQWIFNNFRFNLLIPMLQLLKPQVFITVVDKGVHLDKCLVTHLAVVGALAFLEAHVQTYIRRAHKSAAADTTVQLLGWVVQWRVRIHCGGG